MTATSESNLGRPQGVPLPGDIDDFLQKIAEGYGDGDIDQIMRRVSDHFMHQGMNKDAFGERLKQSYLLKHLDWMKITVLQFHREANIAEMTGFAESNLGVVPASEGSLPLIEGTRLIMEGDAWKLLGNQSKSTLGLYKVFHQLSAYFVPEDRSLYRALLPSPFKMPPEPAVFVKVTDFEQVRLPLPPYKVAHVQILADYEGLRGWYTLTMPENAWIPVEMGKTIGYPKYVADSIVFSRSHNGWEAEVMNKGEHALSLSIQYEQDRSQASWFERMTSNQPLAVLRKLMPPFKEKPWFLLMPVTRGQVLLLRGDPPISGIPSVQETFGRLCLSLQSNQPWAGLFPPEVRTRGVFMAFSGELILRHSLITELAGTSPSA